MINVEKVLGLLPSQRLNVI